MSRNEQIRQRYETKDLDGYRQRTLRTQYGSAFLDPIIDAIPVGGKFLDAGCCNAQLLKCLSKRCQERKRGDIQLYGFDFAKENLEGEFGARNNLSRAGVDNVMVFQDDMKNLSQWTRSQEFDYILSRDVIFFFGDDERPLVFDNLRQICRDGTILHMIIREKRFEKDEFGSRFNDFTEYDLRESLSQHGFITDKAIIRDKRAYSAASQANLDRFYNTLINISRFESGHEPNPEPSLAEIYSENRHYRLQNKGRNEASQLFPRD